MSDKSYLALCGGVGGAKLASGLYRTSENYRLTIVVNTGDDFEHLGFRISPDIDTVLYTLAQMNNTDLGWGRKDESWNFVRACEALGLETWFQLGDRDLATHVFRTQLLAEGMRLTEVIAQLKNKLGIKADILPMSDDRVSTMLETSEGVLSFQDYFVKRRCEPEVSAIYFDNAQSAELSIECMEAFNDKNLKAIIICPSNPFLSIQPILSVPGMEDMIRDSGKPVIVLSPIIHGRSVKGPTEKIMSELKMKNDVQLIANVYQSIATAIVIDKEDSGHKEDLKARGLEVLVADILMNTEKKKTKLAREVISFAKLLCE